MLILSINLSIIKQMLFVFPKGIAVECDDLFQL